MARLFTCRACGKEYDSIGEMAVINITGLSEQIRHDGSLLCTDCAMAWNTRQESRDPGRDPEADFRQFQQERRQ